MRKNLGALLWKNTWKNIWKNTWTNSFKRIEAYLLSINYIHVLYSLEPWTKIWGKMFVRWNVVFNIFVILHSIENSEISEE